MVHIYRGLGYERLNSTSSASDGVNEGRVRRIGLNEVAEVSAIALGERVEEEKGGGPR